MKFVGTLLENHLQRYPAMQLCDIYKLLHQAALGSAHAVDALGARARLDAEIAALGDGPAEPLTDVISPDGRLARVHLRAYVSQGHNVDALLDAFVKTAQTYPGSRDKLDRFCGCLGDLAAAGKIPFTREDTVNYFAGIGAQGYPVVHHSEAYRHAYRPAYRVVMAEYLS
jgi:hypothetical protein